MSLVLGRMFHSSLDGRENLSRRQRALLCRMQWDLYTNVVLCPGSDARCMYKRDRNAQDSIQLKGPCKHESPTRGKSSPFLAPDNGAWMVGLAGCSVSVVLAPSTREVESTPGCPMVGVGCAMTVHEKRLCTWRGSSGRWFLLASPLGLSACKAAESSEWDWAWRMAGISIDQDWANLRMQWNLYRTHEWPGQELQILYTDNRFACDDVHLEIPGCLGPQLVCQLPVSRHLTRARGLMMVLTWKDFMWGMSSAVCIICGCSPCSCIAFTKEFLSSCCIGSDLSKRSFGNPMACSRPSACGGMCKLGIWKDPLMAMAWKVWQSGLLCIPKTSSQQFAHQGGQDLVRWATILAAKAGMNAVQSQGADPGCLQWRCKLAQRAQNHLTVLSPAPTRKHTIQQSQFVGGNVPEIWINVHATLWFTFEWDQESMKSTLLESVVSESIFAATARASHQLISTAVKWCGHLALQRHNIGTETMWRKSTQLIQIQSQMVQEFTFTCLKLIQDVCYHWHRLNLRVWYAKHCIQGRVRDNTPPSVPASRPDLVEGLDALCDSVSSFIGKLLQNLLNPRTSQHFRDAFQDDHTVKT